MYFIGWKLRGWAQWYKWAGMDTSNAENAVLPKWVCPKIEEFDVEGVTEAKVTSPGENGIVTGPS